MQKPAIYSALNDDETHESNVGAAQTLEAPAVNDRVVRVTSISVFAKNAAPAVDVDVALRMQVDDDDWVDVWQGVLGAGAPVGDGFAVPVDFAGYRGRGMRLWVAGDLADLVTVANLLYRLETVR
jgi:hypothetical protein